MLFSAYLSSCLSMPAAVFVLDIPSRIQHSASDLVPPRTGTGADMRTAMVPRVVPQVYESNWEPVEYLVRKAGEDCFRCLLCSKDCCHNGEHAEYDGHLMSDGHVQKVTHKLFMYWDKWGVTDAVIPNPTRAPRPWATATPADGAAAANAAAPAAAAPPASPAAAAALAATLAELSAPGRHIRGGPVQAALADAGVRMQEQLQSAQRTLDQMEQRCM